MVKDSGGRWTIARVIGCSFVGFDRESIAAHTTRTLGTDTHLSHAPVYPSGRYATTAAFLVRGVAATVRVEWELRSTIVLDDGASLEQSPGRVSTRRRRSRLRSPCVWKQSGRGHLFVFSSRVGAS